MSRKRSRKAKSLGAARGNARKQNVGAMSEPRTGGMVMYRSPRTMMPSQYVTNLRYLIDTVVTGVGSTQANIQFRTEAFDVDPTLGSTAMPGFTELAGIYQRYRALRMSYKFSAANQEVFPVSIIHGFSNTSISAAALNLQYAGNPLFSTGMLGPLTGQSRGVFRKAAMVTDIAGTKQALYDDLYTGSTSSATLATAGTSYCYFGVITPIIMTAAGVFVCVEITLQLQFYRPKFILS